MTSAARTSDILGDGPQDSKHRSLSRGRGGLPQLVFNAPVCAPARSALMTGRHPIRCGLARNGEPLRPSEETIAKVLKRNGYKTALTGKWHLGSTPESVPNAHGFDYFYGFHDGCVDYFSHRFYWGEPKRVNFHDLWRNRTEVFDDGQYLTERIGQEAVSFISKQRSSPFFLYTAFNAVHYPMHAPQKYLERFPNLDPERRMYAAMLSAADDQIGEMVRALEHTGQRNNTIIFLLGDNGASTERRAGLNQRPATAGKNKPYKGYKFSTFDGGMHVPGLVNWPGRIPAGQVLQNRNVRRCLTDRLSSDRCCTACGTNARRQEYLAGADRTPHRRMSTSRGLKDRKWRCARKMEACSESGWFTMERRKGRSL